MKGGLMDERMDEQNSPCVLQDFVPFGAAAQKVNFRTEGRFQVKEGIFQVREARFQV